MKAPLSVKIPQELLKKIDTLAVSDHRDRTSFVIVVLERGVRAFEREQAEIARIQNGGSQIDPSLLRGQGAQA